MKSNFRFPSLIVISTLLFTFTPSARAGINETIPDAQTLSQMEQRAQAANPRDQCYLYTELVHTMTEMAVKQIADGDDNNTSAILTQVNHYAHLIQNNLAKNTKHLKNAEMLMHHTTRRLAESLHLASGDDRSSVQATLKQLDLVQDQILNQVFNH
ncbi:MAG TPA: hypothetical protein VFE38_13570 [Edaphobacter sp.]|nr:hypothetical protein [Edaphobacter sp.]